MRNEVEVEELEWWRKKSEEDLTFMPKKKGHTANEIWVLAESRKSDFIFEFYPRGSHLSYAVATRP